MQDARIDFISILVSNSHDTAQQWIHGMVAPWFQDRATNYPSQRGGWKPVAQWNSSLKMTQYYVELWGELSDLWVRENLEFIHLHPITRLDVRYTVPTGTDEGLKGMISAAASMQKGRRNVQTFNSKVRRKTSHNRGSGGLGLAIGSHKSDKRVTVYRRAGEPIAVECQLAGDFLSRLWGETVYVGDSHQQNLRTLEALIDQATYLADNWLAESVGIDPSQLVAALSSPDGTFLSWEGQLSADNVVRQYSLLDPHQKRDVRARLAQLG